jgi:hypothetical protein
LQAGSAQVPVEQAKHGVVQKYEFVSLPCAQIGAVDGQLGSPVSGPKQNLPMPIELPLSQSCPQVEVAGIVLSQPASFDAEDRSIAMSFTAGMVMSSGGCAAERSGSTQDPQAE